MEEMGVYQQRNVYHQYEENSKETWRQIGKIFYLGKRKTRGAETVSTQQFYKYFKQQNATPINNILDP